MDRILENDRPEVSVVVPFFNEAENLEPLVEEIREALASGPTSYELILIDDASEDSGPEVALGMAQADPRIRLVRHRLNLGQSAALITGFDRAR